MYKAWRTSWRCEYYPPRGAKGGAAAGGADARRALAPLLPGSRASCINVPDKGRGGRGAVAAAARALIEAGALDAARVVPHFSCKTLGGAGGRNAQAHERFQEFIDEVGAMGIEKALLVTGSGQRKIDSLAVLQEVARRQRTSAAAPGPSGGVALHVAYSPYAQDLAAELLRLRAKLRTGVVGGVWLQLGSDVAALRRGLAELKRIAHEEGVGAEQLELYGSVLMPSKQLLARFRFRPWVGVYFSDGYLTDVGTAMAITREVLQVYAAHGVTPLWESRIDKAADVAAIQALMDEVASADGAADGTGSDVKRQKR